MKNLLPVSKRDVDKNFASHASSKKTISLNNWKLWLLLVPLGLIAMLYFGGDLLTMLSAVFGIKKAAKNESSDGIEDGEIVTSRFAYKPPATNKPKMELMGVGSEFTLDGSATNFIAANTGNGFVVIKYNNSGGYLQCLNNPYNSGAWEKTANPGPIANLTNGDFVFPYIKFISIQPLIPVAFVKHYDSSCNLINDNQLSQTIFMGTLATTGLANGNYVVIMGESSSITMQLVNSNDVAQGSPAYISLDGASDSFRSFITTISLPDNKFILLYEYNKYLTYPTQLRARFNPLNDPVSPVAIITLCDPPNYLNGIALDSNRIVIGCKYFFTESKLIFYNINNNALEFDHSIFLSATYPKVAAYSNGNFFVTFQNNTDIYGQKFTNAGSAQDAPILMSKNTYGVGNQYSPFPIVLDDDSVANLWMSDNPSVGIHGVVYTKTFIPKLTGDNSLAEYYENGNAVTVAPNIVITDDDSADLTGAVITITNFATEDTLNFQNQNGINGVYSNGVLTLTGTSSLANYQTALRSITFNNPSESPSAGTRTITLTVSDDTDDSNTATCSINVFAFNDAPELSGSGGVINYTENDTAFVIDSNIIITDVDNDNMSSATIEITGNFHADQDMLLFENQNGISGEYNNGVLTLTGTASKADYQTALRSIKYDNTSEDPIEDTRTISFTINDGEDNSNTIVRNINVFSVNDAPQLSGAGSTIDYTENDSSLIIADSLTIADPDSMNIVNATTAITNNFYADQDVLLYQDQNGITGLYDNTTGILTLSGTASKADYQTALRSIKYDNTSEDPITETRTISFIVHDGKQHSNTMEQSINVITVNDAPELSGSGGVVNYTENDPAIVIDDTITIADKDHDDMSGATIAITNNFQANQDILLFVDQNGITGSYDNATGILTLTGTASKADYQAALCNVEYANISEDPAVETRTISFTVNDGQHDSNTIIKTVNVAAINDAPIVSDIEKSGPEDHSIFINATDFRQHATDLDHANLTSIKVLNAPLNGNLLFINDSDVLIGQEIPIWDANFKFNPFDNWFGNTSFPWKGCDSQDCSHIAAQVNLHVWPVNDRPTLQKNKFSINRGQTIPLDTSMLDTLDIDSENLTIKVSDIAHLLFELSNNLGVYITEFTLAQLKNGEVLVTHDDSEETPACKISVCDDDELCTTPATTEIIFSVNGLTAPIIKQKNIPVQEDQTVNVTQTNLSADNLNDETDLRVEISNVTHGKFHFFQQQKPVTNFNQSQINPALMYTHDGSENKPGANIQVCNQYDLCTPVTPINFPYEPINDAPMMIGQLPNTLVIEADKIFNFEISKELFTDPDNANLDISANIIYPEGVSPWAIVFNSPLRIYGKPDKHSIGDHTVEITADDGEKQTKINWHFKVQNPNATQTEEAENPYWWTSIPGLTIPISLAIWFVRRKWEQSKKDASSREKDYFADCLRQELNLAGVDNFDSKNGVEYLNIINGITGTDRKSIAQAGLAQKFDAENIYINTMKDYEKKTLAQDTAAAINVIVPRSRDYCGLGKSKLILDDLSDNLNAIVKETINIREKQKTIRKKSIFSNYSKLEDEGVELPPLSISSITLDNKEQQQEEVPPPPPPSPK